MLVNGWLLREYTLFWKESPLYKKSNFSFYSDWKVKIVRKNVSNSVFFCAKSTSTTNSDYVFYNFLEISSSSTLFIIIKTTIFNHTLLPSPVIFNFISFLQYSSLLWVIGNNNRDRHLTSRSSLLEFS